MAVEFFFVPILELPPGGPYKFGVKYRSDPAVNAGCMKRYSWDSHALLRLDATQTYLDFVAAQADAYRICAEADLDENVGGPGSVAIRSWMQDLNIPETWISAADSHRQVIRTIIGMFAFCTGHERFAQVGFFTDLSGRGFDLNTQWQNLSQEFRDTIEQQITYRGWPDTPAPNDQVRRIMKDFADKFEGTLILMSSVEI